jgi:hypothetical protein
MCYIVPNDTVIMNGGLGMDVEGSGRGLFEVSCTRNFS